MGAAVYETSMTAFNHLMHASTCVLITCADVLQGEWSWGADDAPAGDFEQNQEATAADKEPDTAQPPAAADGDWGWQADGDSQGPDDAAAAVVVQESPMSPLKPDAQQQHSRQLSGKPQRRLRPDAPAWEASHGSADGLDQGKQTWPRHAVSADSDAGRYAVGQSRWKTGTCTPPLAFATDLMSAFWAAWLMTVVNHTGSAAELPSAAASRTPGRPQDVSYHDQREWYTTRDRR